MSQQSRRTRFRRCFSGHPYDVVIQSSRANRTSVLLQRAALCPASDFSHFIIRSLQVATPFITLVIFYYMAMRVDLTSQGHFGQIFAHFRFFFIASPAHLAIIAALRGGYKLVSSSYPRAETHRLLTYDCSNTQTQSPLTFTCGPTPPTRVYSPLKNSVSPSVIQHARRAHPSHHSVSMLYYAASVRAVFKLLQLNIQRQASRAAAPRSS